MNNTLLDSPIGSQDQREATQNPIQEKPGSAILQNQDTSSGLVTETSQKQSTPTPEQLKPKGPNHKLIYIIFGSIILILLAVIGFMAIQSGDTQPEPSPQPNQTLQPTETQTPTPTAASDPTAGWETYTNSEFGYSFKYPSNLMAYEVPPDNSQITLKIPDIELYNTIIVVDARPKVERNIQVDDPLENPVEIADKIFVEKVADITIGGKKAAKFTTTREPGSGTGGPISPEGYLVDIKDNSLSISFTDIYFDNINNYKLPSTDQILSTFQFTE